MSEFPKDGGPNSFDEMRRGLRRRKEKLHQRNIQIKDLQFRLAEKEKVIERYRKALMEIALDRTENLGNPTWTSRTATSALQEGEGGK